MKRVWLDLHRWVGLKLSILLSFVLITGTFATVSHEIDWLIEPGRRVLPAYEADDYDWQGMVDAARAAQPDWVLDWIQAPVDPWFAAETIAITPEGERRRLYIHPGTLEVQGEGDWVNAQRILRDSHRRLMIFHHTGIILVSSLSVLIIISLVSGLVIYKKFWRGFFKKPRTRDARTLWGDLHRLGGLWSLWFIVLIALTGLWYLVESIGFMADIRATPYPKRQIVDATPLQAPDSQVSLNDLVAKIKAVEPAFQVESIWLPAFAGEGVKLRGTTVALLTRERANEFIFDPHTGATLRWTEGTDLNAVQRVSEMADPLHFGTFGGIWTKILYFIFGAILSAMSLSGIYIYSARMRKAYEAQAKRGGKHRDMLLEAAE